MKYAIVAIQITQNAKYFPAIFLGLNSYITILLGVVMFGMGLTLKAVDFKIIATKPLPVIIGVCAQFIIMPLVAYVLAYV
ncbi:bile acid:sodium symporter family protein, partial [Bacillus sp. D-CC]